MPMNMHHSHRVLRRHRQAEQELKPIAAAYTYAMNTVGHARNLELQIYSFEGRTRIHMSEPRYELPAYNAKYCALLKKKDKSLTELDCWLTDGGYTINGQNRHDLNLSELGQIIHDRLKALGSDFVTAFHAHLKDPDIDPTYRAAKNAENKLLWNMDNVNFVPLSKKTGLGNIFTAKSKTRTPDYYHEVHRDLMPLVQAYRYALSQTRDDIGNICVSETDQGLKIAIEIDGPAGYTTFDLFASDEGYSQNPFAPISNTAADKPFSFDELLDLIERAAQNQGDVFAKHYAAHLEAQGVPSPQVQQSINSRPKR